LLGLRVIKTGNQERIGDFFNFVSSTNFFTTYGLYAAGIHASNVAYSSYLAKYIKPRFISSTLQTNIALASGMALSEIYHNRLSGRAFAINVTALGLSSTTVRAAVEGLGPICSQALENRQSQRASKGP
jgi:hypothetical protein